MARRSYHAGPRRTGPGARARGFGYTAAMEPLLRHASPDRPGPGPFAFRRAPLGFAVADAGFTLALPGQGVAPATRLAATGLTELVARVPSGRAALWTYWDVGEAGRPRFWWVIEALEGRLTLELDAESGARWRALVQAGHGVRLGKGDKLVGALVEADDPLEPGALAIAQAAAYDRMLDRWAFRASTVDFAGAQRASVLAGLAELFERQGAPERGALAESALRLWGWGGHAESWGPARWRAVDPEEAARALEALVEAGAILGAELRGALEAGCAAEPGPDPEAARWSAERLEAASPLEAGYLAGVEGCYRTGGYLSARRGLDRWLLAMAEAGPAVGTEALARGLWLGARIYRQAPPEAAFLAPSAYGEG